MKVEDLVLIKTTHDTAADGLDGVEGVVEKIDGSGALVRVHGAVVRFDLDELELVTPAEEKPSGCTKCSRDLTRLGHAFWCDDPFAGITPDPAVW